VVPNICMMVLPLEIWGGGGKNLFEETLQYFECVVTMHLFPY